MRISGINQYLGGADNVIAMDVLQGEQLQLEGTVRDPGGTAVNISGFTLEASTEFYHIDVESTSRATSVSSLALFDTMSTGYDANKLGDATVAVKDGPSGTFTLTLPSNLYQVPITADISTEVPMVVVYVRYSDGAPGTSGTTSRVNRFILIVRRSKFTND